MASSRASRGDLEVGGTAVGGSTPCIQQTAISNALGRTYRSASRAMSPVTLCSIHVSERRVAEPCDGDQARQPSRTTCPTSGIRVGAVPDEPEQCVVVALDALAEREPANGAQLRHRPTFVPHRHHPLPPLHPPCGSRLNIP